MLIMLLKYFYIWEIDKTFRLHLLTALEEWSVQPSLDFSLFSPKRSVSLKIIIVVSRTNVIVVFIFVYKRFPPPLPSTCSALNLIMSPYLSCEQGWHFVCFRRIWHQIRIQSCLFVNLTFHVHGFHPKYEKVAAVVAGRFLFGLFVMALGSIAPNYISTVAPRYFLLQLGAFKVSCSPYNR